MNASLPTDRLRGAAFAGALALGTAFTAALLPALAADAIPSGTTIAGTLTTALDSGKAEVGDGFTVAVTRPYPNDDVSYAGSYIRGHVAKVTRAGQGRSAELDLAFDNIVLASGASAPLQGHVLRVDQKHKTAVVTQAAGAAVGMLVGNYLGKHVGTDLGGAIGAGGGFLYANNKRTDFNVPKDSLVMLETDREVPRPQARY